MGSRISNKNNIDQIEYDRLLFETVRINDYKSMINLIKYRNANIHQILYLHGSKWNLLHVAAVYDSHYVIEYLIDNGDDIKAHDNYGWKPIHHAALSNSCKCLPYLIINDINNLEDKTIKNYPGSYLKNKTAYEIANSKDNFNFMNEYTKCKNFYLEKYNIKNKKC